MGTVHISFLKDVDFFTPLTPFVGIGLGAGQVSERVTVRDGKICIRPMMTISCCCDHAVWDGLTATRFMTGMKKILVEGELWGELRILADGDLRGELKILADGVLQGELKRSAEGQSLSARV
jgi:hypothetical protein